MDVRKFNQDHVVKEIGAQGSPTMGAFPLLGESFAGSKAPPLSSSAN